MKNFQEYVLYRENQALPKLKLGGFYKLPDGQIGRFSRSARSFNGQQAGQILYRFTRSFQRDSAEIAALTPEQAAQCVYLGDDYRPGAQKQAAPFDQDQEATVRDFSAHIAAIPDPNIKSQALQLLMQARQSGSFKPLIDLLQQNGFWGN